MRLHCVTSHLDIGFCLFYNDIMKFIYLHEKKQLRILRLLFSFLRLEQGDISFCFYKYKEERKVFEWQI